MSFPQSYIQKLNEDIERYTQKYPNRHIFPITEDMIQTFQGVSQTVMLDRYANNDLLHETLDKGDFVIFTAKEDPKWPTRGFGWIQSIDWGRRTAVIKVDEQFVGALEGEEFDTLLAKRSLDVVQKPLEIFHEQIAKRNAWGLSRMEKTREDQLIWFERFYQVLKDLDGVPAGRIMYGAGSGHEVTYMNCFTGDTIVQTSQGPVEIKDMHGEWEVYSMNGELRIADFKSFGKQEIYEVELANREKIKTTAGHEWYVQKPKGGYKKVTTLELEGNRIPIVRVNIGLTKEEDYFEGIKHGIVYGDGYISGDGKSTVQLFGEKKELAKYFDGHHIAPHKFDEYVGVYKLPAAWKSLPDKNKTNNYWYGFITGLIATDGSCDSRGSVMIHQSDEEELQTIANNLYRTPFAHVNIRMTRELNPYNDEYSPCYGLQLAKSTITPDDLIKTSHREKFLSSPKAMKTNIDVVSVKALGYSKEVFCCEEPETRSFVIGTGYLTGNCYVTPMPPDSRGGISAHRGKVMEIMSRGGGVGTNGSTLRPRNEVARGVNGKSSGAVSWLNDIANLTNLVEQG